MYAIAPIHQEWFKALQQGEQHEEVNFWTPYPEETNALKKGEPVYFLLEGGEAQIAGHGVFERYEQMTLYAAWDRFGAANGVGSFREFKDRMSQSGVRGELGCVILRTPEFWGPQEFVSLNKYGVTLEASARPVFTFKGQPPWLLKRKRVVRTTQKRKRSAPTEATPIELTPFTLVDGPMADREARRSQQEDIPSEFEERLRSAYRRSCCITGETCLAALKATHIQPYVNPDSDHVQNGLLLRADLHALFAAGLITITHQHRVRTNIRLPESYQQFQYARIKLPAEKAYWPSQEALAFHQKEIFGK